MTSHTHSMKVHVSIVEMPQCPPSVLYLKGPFPDLVKRVIQKSHSSYLYSHNNQSSDGS